MEVVSMTAGLIARFSAEAAVQEEQALYGVPVLEEKE
jgi:hypothetical protein